MAWIFLCGAISFEIAGTLALRAATDGSRRWYVAVGIGYVSAFVFLTLVLNAGLGLGVAYGIWAAAGVALTAVASKFLFKEPLTGIMAAGIALIAGGVLLIELGTGS